MGQLVRFSRLVPSSLSSVWRVHMCLCLRVRVRALLEETADTKDIKLVTCATAALSDV